MGAKDITATLASRNGGPAQRAGHAGTRNVGHFCPECGVRIYHEDPREDYVRLKAGTLNHASELEPDAHIWTRSAPARVRLPDRFLSYETQAGPAEMIAAVQARRAARADPI